MQRRNFPVDYLQKIGHKNRRNKFYDGCFRHKYYLQQGLRFVARAENIRLLEKSQARQKAWDFLDFRF
jgi:ribosomal protein L9